MRRIASSSALFLALLASASPANALEKIAARVDDEDRGLWRSGLTCSVIYFNLCTGWVWIWSDFEPGERVGQIVENCTPSFGSATIVATGLHTWTGSPLGYGFTGSVSVHDVDGEGCPVEPPWGSQPFLPDSGWNTYLWGISFFDRFVISAELGSGPNNPVSFTSDHPAVGPAGPIPCGTCYPTTRVARSFFWGSATSPLCPGSTLFDGACSAQLLSFAVIQDNPVSVKHSSWGEIKALYR